MSKVEKKNNQDKEKDKNPSIIKKVPTPKKRKLKKTS